MPADRAESLVIGVGNRHRGDDAAGVEAAAALRFLLPDHITVCEHGGEAASLVDLWHGRARVYVIDAVRSGALPGTVHRFDACRQEVPAQWLDLSSHSFGLGQAIELGRVLGRLPDQLLVLGIEGQRFGHEERVSAEVRTAIEIVISDLAVELRSRD